MRKEKDSSGEAEVPTTAYLLSVLMRTFRSVIKRN